MSQLQSKWARVDAPLESKPSEPTFSSKVVEGRKPSRSPASLESKWATPIKTGIPSPPSSAGARESEHLNEPKPNANSSTKLAVLDLGKRLGVPDHRKEKDQQETKEGTVTTLPQPKNKHEGLLKQKHKESLLKDSHANSRIGHDNHQLHHSDDHSRKYGRNKKKSLENHKNIPDENPSEYSIEDRGPMTPGARALAMRIGVPKAKDKSNKSQVTEPKLAQKKNGSTKKQVDEVDETIKAEVKAMFDRMSDKSTNWADLEDE